MIYASMSYWYPMTIHNFVGKIPTNNHIIFQLIKKENHVNFHESLDCFKGNVAGEMLQETMVNPVDFSLEPIQWISQFGSSSVNFPLLKSASIPMKYIQISIKSRPWNPMKSLLPAT